MKPERGEFLSEEDWCAKCWAEFTKLDKEEKAIWEFLNKQKKKRIYKPKTERTRTPIDIMRE